MNDKIQFPKQLTASDIPDVLLDYQKQLLTATAKHQVVICEKSRRIGMTWAVGSDAVLTAASNKSSNGMDVFYIGYNLEMAREFINVCGMWAKSFSYIASDVEEWVFEETDKKGDKHAIKAFRISFDSGFEIVALSSKPRSLRGRQGYIIIDEAAFHDALEELLKAALAMLIWGGKVLIISTHDGADNAFNQLIIDARAGRNKYKVVKTDFDQALNDGLYKRICLIRELEWSIEAEQKWRQDIIDFYGDGADEELNCIPRKSAGAYLPSLLVENRMIDVPVIRYEADDKFIYKPEHQRERIIADWCSETLKPLLDKLKPELKSYLGEDFGRSGDLSCLHPIQVMQNLERHTPFTVEMRNIPFAQQRQIVWYILDRLPRFCGAAFDARGNGQQIAEETADRYGHGIIHQIMITQSFYLDAFPKYKAALEDALFNLPRDADVLSDHRAVVMMSGIPQIPNKRGTGEDGGKRHGDSLIAAVMAYWASIQDTMEYDYRAIGNNEPVSSLRDNNNYNNIKTSTRFKGGAW